MTKQMNRLPEHTYFVGPAESERDLAVSNGMNLRRGGPRKLTDDGYQDARAIGESLVAAGVDPHVTMVVYQGPIYLPAFEQFGVPRSRSVYNQTGEAVADGMGMEREAVMLFRGGVRYPNVHPSLTLNSWPFRDSTAMLQISVIADVVGRLVEESERFANIDQLGGLVVVLDTDMIEGIVPEAVSTRKQNCAYALYGTALRPAGEGK